MRTNGKTNSPIRFAVVDDDPLVADSLRNALEPLGGFEFVAACGSGMEFLDITAQLPQARLPDLVLLEIRLPEMDGYELCRALQERHPGMLIAIHTTYRLPCFVNGARHVGADAYFCKPVAVKALATDLQGLQRTNGMLLDPQALLGGVTGSLILTHEPRLSTQMEKVLELEAQGCCVKQIADQLKVGESGVYTLKQKALRRLEAACQPMPIA